MLRQRSLCAGLVQELTPALAAAHHQGTATFRKMFGFTEVVGSSPLAILPAQCALTLHFYWKALINLTIPAVLALGAVVISLAALVVRHVKTRKLREQLQQLHPQLQGLAHQSGARSASPRHGALARQRHRDVRTGLCAKLKAYFSDKQYLSTGVFVLFLSYNLVGSSVRCVKLTCVADACSSCLRGALACAQVMTVLKCHHTPIGGVFYLAADFSVVCYDSQHWMMILVAVSIGSVFCLGVPLFMVWMLRKNKEHLTNPAFFSRFGFLIDGYRPDTSWYGLLSPSWSLLCLVCCSTLSTLSVSGGRWESVVMLRKLVVLIVAAVVVDPYMQVCWPALR